LGHELADYRSIRAVGQRYRIIYRVEEEWVLVVVVTVGIRRAEDKKDVYEVAKKLARLSLFDLENLEQHISFNAKVPVSAPVGY